MRLRLTLRLQNVIASRVKFHATFVTVSPAESRRSHIRRFRDNGGTYTTKVWQVLPSLWVAHCIFSLSSSEDVWIESGVVD